MIQATYSELIRKIADSAGVEVSEVERRVDEKKAKLSDLISKEGAAQIVAAELGVNFDKQKSKISGLLIGMRRASTVAKILRAYPVREFTTKNNVQSKVANFLLADDTGIIKGVLWDVNQIRLLEEGKIKEGDVVDLKDATVRQGLNGKELHLGSTSVFALSAELLPNVVQLGQDGGNPEAQKRKISELLENERAAVRGVIIQMFEPKFFNVCPECGKKPTVEADRITCQAHGAIVPKERALMNFVMDDGTGNMRAVCFNEIIGKMFHVEESGIKGLAARKNEVLGKEMILTGRVRKNKIYDNLEFVLSDVEEVNPEKLIGEMQPSSN